MSDLNRVSDLVNGVSNTVTALMVPFVWPVVFPVDTCINKYILDVNCQVIGDSDSSTTQEVLLTVQLLHAKNSQAILYKGPEIQVSLF